MLGGELVPPMKLKNRDPPWQALQPCTLDMQGSSWRRHSRDIAFAGLVTSLQLHVGCCQPITLIAPPF